MKRRTFLQATGLALAAAPALAEESAAPPDAPKLLITGAHTPLAQALATALASSYRLTLTSSVETQGPPPFIPCDLSDTDAASALVSGRAAVVHLPDPDPETTGAELIAHRTRATYGLLQAAARAEVSGLIYLSSLEVMLGYEPGYQVGEDWRPRPGVEPGPLSHHLGEFACREFAREGKLRIAVLRLGHLPPTEATDPMRLELPDAVRAVSRALAAMLSPRRPLGDWSVFHLVSDIRNNRFPPTRRLGGLSPGQRHP